MYARYSIYLKTALLLCTYIWCAAAVVPYRALIENLVARIRDYSVDCIEWMHSESDPASVVVVSADVAGEINKQRQLLSYGANSALP
jgi:hypothetical protein